MTENPNLANTLLKEINQLHTEIIKINEEKQQLEWQNSRLSTQLYEKERLLEELVSTEISPERKEQIRTIIMKDEIIQDE